VVCAVLVLCGCASPESRIGARPAVFARLTPDQQALVKEGKVAPGFDMDTVRLALGDPDRVVIETNASGRHEIWRYVSRADDQEVPYLEGNPIPYSVQGGPYLMSVTGNYNSYPGYPGKQWGDLYIRPNLALYTESSLHERVYEMIRVVFDTNGRVVTVRQRNP
jgi:hypothetical protein